MASNIQVSPDVYRDVVRKLDPNRGGGAQKINAIKTLRNGVKGHLGLREAKRAVERISYEMFNSGGPIPQPDDPRVFAGPRLKRLTVDMGDGDIEVDLEAMQLIALMKLQEVGLDACREILHLVDVLQAFSAGKQIAIIEEEEEEDA